MRLCTEQYEAPDRTNVGNARGHLKNYSLNKGSDAFCRTEELSTGSKRSLSACLPFLFPWDGGGWGADGGGGRVSRPAPAVHREYVQQHARQGAATSVKPWRTQRPADVDSVASSTTFAPHKSERVLSGERPVLYELGISPDPLFYPIH